MNEESRQPGRSRFAIAFFAACLLLLLYALFLVFSPFFTALAWAGVLSVVCAPFYRRILKLFNGRESFASGVTCILIFLLIVLPMSLLGTMLVRQSVAIYHGVEASLSAGGEETAGTGLERLRANPHTRAILEALERAIGTSAEELQRQARDALRASSGWVVRSGASLIAGLGGGLFTFVLVFIVMFFLFRDGPALVKLVRASNPLPEEYEARIIGKFVDVSYATFVGSILTALVQGAAASVLFWALGVPSPLFWGAIVSVVSLLPILGAFLVWLPMSSWMILAGDVTRGVILILIGGLVVSSIDNLLKPIIIRERTNMHPLLVFLSVMGGIQAFGFLGVLLGPLIVAVFIVSLEFYRQEFQGSLGKKSRSSPTA